MSEARSIAPGSDGAGLARRLYRRSPLRAVYTSAWQHRGLRPADVFMASYPRSGSSWVRFLIMELTLGEASFDGLTRAMPPIGAQHRGLATLPGGGRFIKTHEPYHARYRKALHLVRDPRDVAISYFPFMQRIGKIVVRAGDDRDASFDRFIDAFIAGRVDAYGTWQSHLMSWLDGASSGRSDVLRLRYEDLRSDPAGKVVEISQWLGLPVSMSRAVEIVERCSIERMRDSESKNVAHADSIFARQGRATGIGVINTGTVEAWRERMTPAQVARFGAFARGLAAMGYAAA